MVDRMSPAVDRQALCVAAPAARGRQGETVSVFTAGMSPLMSRVSVICERDSFTGISPVAGTGQQAGIRPRCDLVSEQLLCRRKPQMYGNHFF